MTWLKPVFIIALTTSLCACSSSSNSTTGASPSPCYGPGCYNSSSNGGASSNGGSSSGTIVADASIPASWSLLCGSEDAGCLPDSDAGGCDDITDGVASTGYGDAGTGTVADGSASDSSSSLACRIRSVSGSIAHVCEPAGMGKTGAPCRMPADCAKGLTCVTEGLATLCRPYCCGDSESCPSKTYCTSLSTLVDRDSWLLGSEVPVCTAAENCPLSEPYPCPQGQNCTCPTGKACMIVRRQGLTACVKPGTSIQGGLCPCAAGYVCSNTTFTCLKLCQLTSSANAQTSSQCSTGNSCQASNDVPTDWGVCNDLPLIVNSSTPPESRY